MIETMSRPPYQDCYSKSGASNSGSDTNLQSVSFTINTSDPDSDDLEETSFMFSAMSGPISENPFSQPMSDLFEMSVRNPCQISKDPYGATTPDEDIASSFLAFSMSQPLAEQSRETGSTPKPQGSFAFVTLSRSAADMGLEATDVPSASRLTPCRTPSKITSTLVQKYLQSFKLSDYQLLNVKNSMQKALENGLKNQEGSSLTIIPTQLCALPDGTERGHFLALQMTQTIVKVKLLNMTDGDIQQAKTKSKTFAITENVRKGTVDQLFEFLAECLQEFLLGSCTSEKHIPLGFCFPFACKYLSIDKCYLLNPSKDFPWSGMEGKNVAELLQTAINNHCKNHQIEVIAVVNDTVGTMLSCCSEKTQCEVGLVIDSGTNSCYMEQAHEIKGIDEKEGFMCVNTEWGAFGKTGELDDILTEIDLLMDKESTNPGEQRFEKMISSLYISDTVRIFLSHLAEKGELLGGAPSPDLLAKGSLELQDIAEIIDEKKGLSKAKNFLSRLGTAANHQDCCYLQRICQAVFLRSASLCAAGVAAVLTRLAQYRPKPKVNVAVDGIMYNYKQYREILNETLKSLVPDYTINFIPSCGNITLGVIIATAAAIRHKNQHQHVAQILAPFRLSLTDYEKVQNLMRQEMKKGLALDKTATVRMLPTFVRHLPDGSERGKFLALDLGGTNFRVLMVELKDPKDGGVHITSEIYTVPPEIAQSYANKLFDHIVSCIVDFETKHKMLGVDLPLGFTFSFPCRQIGLDKGILLAWTKGFSATGCVGEDAVQLLRDAVSRQKSITVDIVAIVNDTVGTMMSCAYVDPKCEIGLIVGTGSNACYMEEMKNVDALEGDEGQMCINMEWGAFGDSGCLDNFMTSFDVRVDAESLNAGQQRYEKLISGMYLGEIVRYILLDLITLKVVFRGHDSPVLRTKGIFPTKFLSDVEDSEGEERVCAMLEECKLTVTPEDARIVKEVCRAVSSRAAKMCGAGIAAVVEKMRDNRQLEKLELTVGVDGTLYKVHPKFSKELHETVALLAPKCSVKFLLSEDGSGKGAALVAAVAAPQSK